MTDMVVKCSQTKNLDKKRPTLKDVWKWIKELLRNYMIAQRQLTTTRKHKKKKEQLAMFSTFSPDSEHMTDS